MRHPIRARVTAVATQMVCGDRRKRICSLQLLNLSQTGLAATTTHPLEPGTRVAVFFPPHGPEQGFDLFGTIVRCVTDHRNQTVIGVRLDQRRAA